jgi:hypothetical protein
VPRDTYFSVPSGSLALLNFFKRAKSTKVLSTVIFLACVLITCVAFVASAPRPPDLTMSRIEAPLKVSTTNPNYFVDSQGHAVLLTGSHTWNNLQDWGSDGRFHNFDFDAYVQFLKAHNHNFTLLWRTELPHFCNMPTGDIGDYDVREQPWMRTGPGTATDGLPKFDLTKFDQGYFDRLRARVNKLYEADIYAGVYLFTGEWISSFRCEAGNDGYPFSGDNNVNGVTDGGSGERSITMTEPDAITQFQDAYIRKTIDTLSDLPNVLWMVSEEAPKESAWWNQHLIEVVKSYEARKPMKHAIGLGVTSDNDDASLYNSNADWVAPAVRVSPVASCGTGTPPCKVNINDSDHSYYGAMWTEPDQKIRNYFWENFAAGNSVVFMDPYEIYYPRDGRNLCASPVGGICSGVDQRWENVRATMGYIRSYADRMDLIKMVPTPRLTSTGVAIADTAAVGPEVLAYSPDGGEFSVDLSFTTRALTAEWLNPATGEKTAAGTVRGGSVSQPFQPPFPGDAVLYLYDPSPWDSA